MIYFTYTKLKNTIIFINKDLNHELNKMGIYIPPNKIKKIIEAEKEKGNKIILTGGCFDILHQGHIYLFEEAKKYGNILIVNVVNDKRVKTYKGKERPINSELERATMVAALDVVDYSTIYPSIESGPTTNLARIIKPDVMIQRSKKWKKGEKKHLKELLGYDIQTIGIENSPFDISTTSIIEKVLQKN